MNTLTDQHRAYLRQHAKPSVLFYDLTLGFMAHFQLTPKEAGRLLAKWILETC